MSLASRLIQRRASEETFVSNPRAWLLDMFGGGPSATGIRVNADRAIRIIAVYACVRILAETLGSLPLHLYRRLPNGGKERATSHPLYWLMHDSPNIEMTSMELRETSMGHNALRGNSYAQLTFGGDGRVKEINPLHPDRTKPERLPKTDELVYVYSPTDGRPARTFRADEILHVRGLGTNGICGYDPITLAREAMGLAVATETHGAKFFANGTTPSGFIQFPQGVNFKDDQFKRLRDSFAEKYQGVDNSHKPILLEDGGTWQSIGINHENAQFLETRKFQTNEIARLFRMPPHMIADLEKATFSNIEQQSLEFVIHTMLPWLARHEQRYNRALLLPDERREYFFELNIDALLRGDIKSRYEAFQIARQNGWLSVDEIRAMENTNPLPEGKGGDIYTMQSSFVPLDMLGKNVKPPSQEQKQEGVRAALIPALTAACLRTVRKESKALATLHKRGLPVSDLAQFYVEHREYIAENVGPIFEGLGRREVVRAFADEICAEHQRIVEGTRNAPETFNALAAAWDTTRGAQLSNRALALLAA